MPRTQQQLEQAAADAEAWLDSLDPASATAEDTADLRTVAIAVGTVSDAERDLRDAVHTARLSGRSWGRIAMVLGVSKQAAQRRFNGSVEAR